MDDMVYMTNKAAEVHAAETTPSISVRLFGTFEIENHQGQLCESNFRENQSLALLRYLMTYPTREVCLPELMETIWAPNRRGGDLDTAVVLRVRRARELLKPLGLFKIRDGLLISGNGMYHLNPNYTIWRDVDEFDRLMDQIDGCALEDPDGLQMCFKALELYRGPFLEQNKAVPWIVKHRSYYHQRFIVLVDSTLDRMKKLQQFEALPILCSKTASIIPDAEVFHRKLIQLLMDLKEKKLLMKHMHELACWKARQEK